MSAEVPQQDVSQQEAVETVQEEAEPPQMNQNQTKHSISWELEQLMQELKAQSSLVLQCISLLDEICGGSVNGTMESEEEMDGEGRLQLNNWKSGVKSDRKEMQHHHVYKEEVLTDQTEEQFVLEQKTDTFIETSTYEERDHSEPEPNMDQLHSNMSPVYELYDHEGSKQEEPGPSPNLVLKANKSSDRSRSKTVKSSYLSDSLCDVDSDKTLVKRDVRGNTLKIKSSLKKCGRIYTGEKPDIGNTGEKSVCASSASQGHRHIDERKPNTDKSHRTDFSHLSSLNLHNKVHSQEKSYSCKLCDKTFKHSTRLLSHMRIHAGKKYSCKECGKKFRHKGHCSSHMRTHTGEKPYSCKECGRSFSHKCSLLKHIRSHTGEKPYYCKQCGNRFFRKEHLSKHIRIHTGEKPFSCKQCGKSFSRSDALLLHTRTHTNDKPYSCKQCGKSFCQKCNLLVHMRTHISEKPDISNT